MKRIFLLDIILILSISLSGCSSTHLQDISLNPSQNTGTNTNTKMTSSNQLVLAQGDSITVNGENTRSSFHSVDFIDKNSGWMVRDEFNSPGQSSQILKTEDGGASWETIKLNNTVIRRLIFVNKTTGWAIVQAASNTNTAASNKSTTSGEQSQEMKILHTQDGGRNWDVQWEGKVNLSSSNNLWFRDAAQGYALISGTMIATRDGGQRWSPVSFNINDFTPQHMSFVNAATGWVIGMVNPKAPSQSPVQSQEGKLVVLQTLDGGKHWQQQFAQDYPDGRSIGSVGINFANGTSGWFLTSNMLTWAGDLYYTANAGRDWRKINQIKSVRPTPTELQFLTPQVGWIPLDVGAGPISGGLLLTKDGGKNFTRVGSDVELSSVREVDFISEEQGWAIGETPNQGDYLIRTGNGGQNWIQVYPKLRPTKDISFVDNQHGYGLGQLFDSGALLYTADGGDTWQKIFSFSEKYRPSKLSFVNRNLGWVTAVLINADKTVILKTTDGGINWTPLDSEITQSEIYFSSYFRFFDSDSGIVATTDAGAPIFYRTPDGGRTWELIPQGSKGIYQFSFLSPKQGWKIFEVGQGQFTLELSRMEDGVNWQSMGQISAQAWPYGIDFVSPAKGFILIQEPPFQTNSQLKLLVTTDGGRTWSPHPFPNGFLLETLADQMPIQFTDEQHGWILSTQGLLRTQDGGKTWAWE